MFDLPCSHPRLIVEKDDKLSLLRQRCEACGKLWVVPNCGTDHETTIRKLRAKVLRAHAMAVAEFRGAHGEYPPHFRRRMRNRHRCFKWERVTQTGLDLTAEQRAARLLLHWAKAIEEGRL
jgi:hypothetical protein